MEKDLLKLRFLLKEIPEMIGFTHNRMVIFEQGKLKIFELISRDQIGFRITVVRSYSCPEVKTKTGVASYSKNSYKLLNKTSL